MQLIVNGETMDVTAEANTPLLWVIRNDLNMTGTKFGCGGGYCGSCTVIVDGVATRSCVTLLQDVADKEIRTIEGLAAADGTLHPVQQAFLDHQVPQCAWCMSGQMMTATAFLEAADNPASVSDNDIVEAMGSNYCRCGCYVRIKAAVKEAAQTIGGVA